MKKTIYLNYIEDGSDLLVSEKHKVYAKIEKVINNHQILNKEIKGSQNQVMEPVKVSSHPLNDSSEVQVFKLFGNQWRTVGWQNQVMRLPETQVGSHPSGFKTQSSSKSRVPALPSINSEILGFELAPIVNVYGVVDSGKDAYSLNSGNKKIKVKSIIKQPYNGKIYDVEKGKLEWQLPMEYQEFDNNKEILVSKKHKVYAQTEDSLSPISIVMMFESIKNNSISFEPEKENKGAHLNSFEIAQIMPEILKMFNRSFIIRSDLSNLLLNSGEQNRILLPKLGKNLTDLRRVYLHNSLHHLLNSSTVIALPEGSFLASLSSLMNSSFNGSSSTGYQSISSQNSWFSSDNLPVLRNSSKILFLFNFSLATSDQLIQGNFSKAENNLSSNGNVMLTIYNSPLFSRSSNLISLNNFSTMPSFAISGQFISGILSNLTFNSLDIDTVNRFILLTSENLFEDGTRNSQFLSTSYCVDKRKCVDIYKPFGFVGKNET